MPRNKRIFRMPDALKAFFPGFLAGMISGFTIRTGVSLDPGEWSIFILRGVCALIEGKVPFNCYAWLGLISLCIMLIMLLLVWRTVSKVRGIRIFGTRIPGFILGICIYLLGFISGAAAMAYP